MKNIIKKCTVAGFLVAAGFAYSNKGNDGLGLKISRAVANDGTFVTLEWNSSPGVRYTVESGIDMNDWEAIAENLVDPNAPGTYVYQIPEEYVFDSRRFFRVVSVK